MIFRTAPVFALRVRHARLGGCGRMNWYGVVLAVIALCVLTSPRQAICECDSLEAAGGARISHQAPYASSPERDCCSATESEEPTPERVFADARLDVPAPIVPFERGPRSASLPDKPPNVSRRLTPLRC